MVLIFGHAQETIGDAIHFYQAYQGLVCARPVPGGGLVELVREGPDTEVGAVGNERIGRGLVHLGFQGMKEQQKNRQFQAVAQVQGWGCFKLMMTGHPKKAAMTAQKNDCLNVNQFQVTGEHFVNKRKFHPPLNEFQICVSSVLVPKY